MWVSINGDIPIAGWFMVEKPIKIDVKSGTPILGTPPNFALFQPFSGA